MTEDSREQDSPSDVANVIVALYASLGDRQSFDSYLDSDITIWESDAARLLRGLPALDVLRDTRAAERADGPPVISVVPEILSVDLWGDTALACSLLWVTLDGDDAPIVHRMTDVLRRTDRWRIVHHHAELERSHTGE